MKTQPVRKKSREQPNHARQAFSFSARVKDLSTVSDFVVRSGNLVSLSVISIYLRGHLYVYTRLTLLPEAALPSEATMPPGTCPAEPLRTGEYTQQSDTQPQCTTICMLYIATAYYTCVLIPDSTSMTEKSAHSRRREDMVVISVGDLRGVGMERAGNSDPP
jgi:hypothetical protein